MSELLTTEEIETLKTISRFESYTRFGFDLSKISSTLEAQQAQIKGLVGALEYAKNHDPLQEWIEAPTKEIITHCGVVARKAEQALSTLPAAFLEREKAREALVSAAREWFRTGESTNDLWLAVEALEALEGGE